MPPPELKIDEGWVLISMNSLRAMYCDATKLVPTITLLKKAQTELNETTTKLKKSRQEVFDKSITIHGQREELAEYKNPLWYTSPWFWGVVGVATGFVAGVILKVYFDRRENAVIVNTPQTTSALVAF